MPSLDNLVILNFILKNRSLTFTITFWVLRYTILSLYTGFILSAIYSLIGSSFY